MSITAQTTREIVLGTRDSAPLDFWVGIDEGQMLPGVLEP